MNKQTKTYIMLGVVALLAVIALWVWFGGDSEPAIDDETAQRAAQIEAELQKAATEPPPEAPPPPPGTTAIRRGPAPDPQ